MLLTPCIQHALYSGSCLMMLLYCFFASAVPTGDVVTTGVPVVGGSLSVTCINGGNGTGEDFSWSGRTSSNTARLTFVSATLEDQGDYNCSFRIQETQRRGLFTYNVVIYGKK